MYLEGNEIITLSEAIDHHLMHLANLCETVKCLSKDIIPYNEHAFGEIHVEGIACLKETTTRGLPPVSVWGQQQQMP